MIAYVVLSSLLIIESSAQCNPSETWGTNNYIINGNTFLWFKQMADMTSSNPDGWIGFSNNDCVNWNNDNAKFCVVDGCFSSDSCLKLYGACDIYSESIDTTGYSQLQLSYLLVEADWLFPFEPGDLFNIYYSIDDGNNWIQFKSYGTTDFSYDQKLDPNVYTTEHIEFFDLPSESQDVTNLRIRFQNTGQDGKYDMIFISFVGISGIAATQEPAPTATPTTVTTAPTPQPTTPTAAPIVSTATPTTVTTAPTLQTPTPTAAPNGSDAFSKCDDSNFESYTYTDPCSNDANRRHRRPYHLLTCTERKFYVDGLKAIRDVNGIDYLQGLAYSHQKSYDMKNPHDNPAFLPWHRFFLWEIERLVRSQPGFECWTVPYWDWTNEEGNGDDWWILSDAAYLGGDGYENNGWCINEPFHFTIDGFGFDVIEEETGSEEWLGFQCIRRDACIRGVDGSCNVKNTVQFYEDTLTEYDSFGGIDGNCNAGFHVQWEDMWHNPMHCLLGNQYGGNGAYNGWHLCETYSPSDPIFWLLHSFVDMGWALWQSCHGYTDPDVSGVSSCTSTDQSTCNNNAAYCGRDSNSNAYTELEYPAIQNASWFYYESTEFATRFSPNTYLTPKDMIKVSDWGISFDYGSFDQTLIDNSCSNGWFQDLIDNNRRRLRHSRIAMRKKEEIISKTLKDDKGKWQITKSKMKEAAKLSCNEDRARFPNAKCEIPEVFYGCDDLKDGANGDIDISLAELLRRVRGNQCMMTTRTRYYFWAKKTLSLRGLCDGDYDTYYCDRDQFKRARKSNLIHKSISPPNVVIKHDPLNGITTMNKKSNINDDFFIYGLGVFILFVLLCLLLNIIWMLRCIDSQCKKRRKYNKTDIHDDDDYDTNQSEQEIL